MEVNKTKKNFFKLKSLTAGEVAEWQSSYEACARCRVQSPVLQRGERPSFIWVAVGLVCPWDVLCSKAE